MLLPYLRQLQASGQTHLPVTEEAREVLRKLYKGQIPLKSPLESVTLPPEPASKASQVESPSVETEPTPLPSNQKLEIQGTTEAEKLEHLQSQIQNWGPIQALDSLRKTLVFSTGNPKADLMLIGEAPSYHDERAREPFSNQNERASGQKLDAILKAMGLSREQAYLTNICKYRPALPGQTTNSRNPRPEELAACMPFLRAEIAIVQPKVIIALGTGAAQNLLNSSEPFESLRQNWHNFEAIPLKVSHHPSYLLLPDQDALGEKRKIWEDMLVVMGKMSLPISDKQQGYFLPKK